MPSSKNLLVLAVLVLGALMAAVATAATPSSGKVSKDTPSVSWEGSITQGAATFNAFTRDPEAPCTAPSCDTFALDVADGPANLELVINLGRTGSSGDADAGFRITAPDGTVTWVSGPSGPEKAFKHIIKNAKNGAYKLDITDSFVGTPGTYAAKATLLIPGAAAPAPVANPTPATTTQPAPAPQAPAPAVPTLTAKAGSASAKKLAKKRKLAVKLTTTAPLTKLAAVLRKGTKSVGKGALAKLDSSGTLTVKLPKKKLKPGSYKLTVQGLDAQGRTASATVTVKIKK